MKTKELELNQITTLIDPIVNMRNTWFLVTSEVNGQANTLTCGWGAFGNVWEKKTMTVYIRPQRHTLPFMDESGYFTATFFEGFQKELIYLGSNSGKDVPNKIELSGLHLAHIDNQPVYEEAKYALICKILYKQQLKQESFVDKELGLKNYSTNDYSYVYVAEIVNAYEIIK